MTVISREESTVITIDEFTTLLPYVGDALEAGNSRVADGRDALLSVAMCPPDGGFRSVFTCVLGFAATMILDGVCLSLFLYDSRIGMTEQLILSSSLPALNHLSVVWLCRYLIEPFSCAYINRYGFRYSLFFGSVLSVVWITLLTYFIGNAELPFDQFHFVLAVIGGIGIGMVKTAFVVLLSTLFVIQRETAHLCLHLGSFTGMLLIPSTTKFLIVEVGCHYSTFLLSGLTLSTLVFWLLVTTPVPLQVSPETETSNDKKSGQLSDGTVNTVAKIK